MSQLEMGYWGIRGLGSVLRMVFEYKEAQYTDVQFTDGAKWFKEKKPEILAKNPLANLPYVVDGDTVVCQTNAIMAYLGQKYDMEGKDARQKLRHLELLCEIYDVRNGMIELVYPFKKVNRTAEEYEAAAKEKVENPPFAKFESCLEVYGGDWFVAPDGPCVADFHIWEMLDQHKLLGEKHGQPAMLDNFPKCKAFYDRFRALPTLQKYFASESYKLPINNGAAGAYFM
uniref:glutathione transferase n=2 Tax=Oxyrrhis marina TaxID=2969 RepID=A0A7S4LNK5_OXYMA|mmetsp:Transcript_12488/g.29755  ORF Transcript_12488/g.29755 Transcript_12488/m.29755 type:complete len:229 (+) Transcript_12488:67-753(+)